jgi:hypothetical protein
MFGRIRNHLRSNVIGYIALFFALSTGSAVALAGSNTVFSDDIVDNEVYRADVRNDGLSGGGLGAVDLRPDSVGTSEIGNSAVDAAEIGDGIHIHFDTVSVPGGGTPQDGSYDTATVGASCNPGEELISGNAEWSATPPDAELFISKVHVDHGGEAVVVTGGNDTGTARALVAVAQCLEV